MATSNLTLTTNIDVVEETVLLDSDHHQQIQSGVQSDSSEIDLSSSNSPCFVAVHIGAGFHSQNKTGSYRLLCEQICSSVIRLLKQGCNARTAAATACALLENSPLTNAGLGSNLTLDEKIECDASIMDKDGFGSVGAVSNIKNPIMIALSLLEAQSHGTLSMGRIVPCMLVGNGARLWAREKGLEEVDDEFLKTEPMKKSFFYYKKKLDELNEELTSSMSSLQTNCEQPQHSSEHQLGGNTNNNSSSGENSSQLFNQTELKETDESRSLDTVGAIVLDMNGRFASAISSGGILLKLPGRVGHASFFGCGCWVDEADDDLLIDDQQEDESNSIAICTTGCGEYIIKTLFAKECAEHILANTHKPDYDLNEFYKKKFFNSRLLKNCPDKLIGALICKLQKLRSSGEGLKERKILELLVTHTTPSMCFGYMSSGMRKPKSVMSRKEEDKPSESVLISNIYIDLSSNEFNSSSSTSQTAQNPNQAADFAINGDNKKRKIINQNT